MLSLQNLTFRNWINIAKLGALVTPVMCSGASVGTLIVYMCCFAALPYVCHFV